MNGGFPDKYYLCIIHRRTHIYNSLELPFYTSQFIYIYHIFVCTSIVEIILYMYVPYICLYINCCNHAMFFFPLSVVVEYYICFSVLFIRLAYGHCNPTKWASILSPFCVPITATYMITDMKPYQPPFHTTSLTPSSSCNTLPWHHSSHQESGTRSKCYS